MSKIDILDDFFINRPEVIVIKSFINMDIIADYKTAFDHSDIPYSFQKMDGIPAFQIWIKTENKKEAIAILEQLTNLADE